MYSMAGSAEFLCCASAVCSDLLHIGGRTGTRQGSRAESQRSLPVRARAINSRVCHSNSQENPLFLAKQGMKQIHSVDTLWYV